MFKVVGTVRSRTVRVIWALEELGLQYEMIEAAPRSETAMRYNPSGKIPSLIVSGDGGETVVTDSVAIVQYLADRQGEMTYAAGSIERARQDAVTQFACDEVDGALWLAAKHSFALPEALRVAGVKETARAEFARAMETLHVRLGDGPFVMGERFTVPDLVLGHCASWAGSAKFELPGGAVGDYFERVRGRPALARALATGAEAGRD